jgi:AmmeMemoRadiSam system protein B
MSKVLALLRRGLDFIPSLEPQRPGLVIRDPMRYTKTVLYVPPLWVHALRCLDGEHTELDMQEMLTRATGKLVFSDEIHQFVDVLRQQGFLETEEFYQLRDERHREFKEGRERPAIYAGMAYPASAGEVHGTFEEYFHRVEPVDGLPTNLLGVAAPHVSPEGGWSCYATTYRRLALSPALADRTFIVLGTSHYGAPDRFGLTRKPFVTPLGTVQVDTEVVDWLEQHGGRATSTEDYCHAIEHSIEFQCVFLQHALGTALRMVPILCGPFTDSLHTERPPESNDAVAHFFGALGELFEKEAGRLFWVLGIDLAHVGRRYGDSFSATAHRGQMTDVEEQDRQRLELACQADQRGFFELVNKNGDELKWCGYSALYTFMKAVPQARGKVLGYEQWNIDPQSVVSFASVEFFVP